MQTFLPYPSFARCARVLDPARLGKQRVEALQILRALAFDDYGWRAHPVVRMWRGYDAALVAYGVSMCEEWRRRGHADACLPQIAEFTDGRAESQAALRARSALPPWLGWQRLHRSHRSALVRKAPAHYRRFFPHVSDALPYVWPPASEVPEPPPAPLAAWVVRAPSIQAARAWVRQGIAALADVAAPRTRAGTKTTRQVDAFRDGVRPGDVALLLAGDRLVVGEIAGGHRRTGRRHVRPVRWLGEIGRHALPRPARLQDPRRFFALRGDDDPRALLSCGAGRVHHADERESAADRADERAPLDIRPGHRYQPRRCARPH